MRLKAALKACHAVHARSGVCLCIWTSALWDRLEGACRISPCLLAGVVGEWKRRARRASTHTIAYNGWVCRRAKLFSAGLRESKLRICARPCRSRVTYSAHIMSSPVCIMNFLLAGGVMHIASLARAIPTPMQIINWKTFTLCLKMKKINHGKFL